MNEMDTRFANQYNIQWFPGHMTKTLRMMEQEIQHVDASLVLLDARIPLSSLNPEIERITARKPKLYALNKADLADPAVTEEWIKYFRAADAGCVAISAKQKGGANAVKVAIEKELAGLLERRQNRGMGGAKTQVMLCGIPNVGKSTFINTFAGSARAKAADRPGVTKGKQWIRLNKNVELLDTPGILWPKFEDQSIGLHLALSMLIWMVVTRRLPAWGYPAAIGLHAVSNLPAMLYQAGVLSVWPTELATFVLVVLIALLVRQLYLRAAPARL